MRAPACGAADTLLSAYLFSAGRKPLRHLPAAESLPLFRLRVDLQRKNHWGKVRIDVEAVESNTYRLIYALPGNPERDYLVRFAGAEDRYAERQIVISSGGVERFRGTYHPDGLFLYNEQGEPVLDVDAFVSHDGKNPFAGREPSYYDMAQLASGSGDTVQGNGALLFSAVLIAALWAVDRRWPRLFLICGTCGGASAQSRASCFYRRSGCFGLCCPFYRSFWRSWR